MLWLGRPRGERRLAPPRLRRRGWAERAPVHPPLRRPHRLLLGLGRGRRRRREAPVGGRNDGAEPPHRRHVDPAGAHGGGGGRRGELGTSRARDGIRVPGEEERGGHDQGAGPVEGADATPQDGGQEHHHPFRRGGRLTCLMQTPCCSARGGGGRLEDVS
uniref:Uncharacterized protein n=1 Tax=Arundo donax TaxID=35708 RepID=A0A0A9DB23_ARUDO